MRVCFYSAIKDDVLFSRVGFYRDDIEALKMGSADVVTTSSLIRLFRCRPNMIVAYFYSKSLYAAFYGRIVGARIILTGGADQISPVLISGRRLLLRRVFAFLCLIFAHRILVACTEDLINFRRLCFGVTSLINKIELVNHVVISSPLAQFATDIRHDRFRAFTLCWMGTEANVRRKGVDRAVRLIGLLRSLGVSASLDIAGSDGPGKVFLERLVGELDLLEHVSFLGVISEKEKNCRMVCGGVYLQLSEHEGFGVAAAEAFFSGMTVVHSNRGGLRDVIGEHGLVLDLSIIDNADPSALNNFYSDFLRYKPNFSYLKKNVDRYSIKSRSDAFFRRI